MNFEKVSDYLWTCGPYSIKRHHCGGGEKFSVWVGEMPVIYFDSYESAERECELQEQFDKEYK